MGIQSKIKTGNPQERYRLMWMDVMYEPGTLKVVALDDHEKPVATKEVKTAGKPYQIVLHPDRTNLQSDGKDLSFVTVSVVDKNGIECPTATNQLTFKVTGTGNFKAVCNGDATSLELFHLPTMKLFSGKLVVLVQADTKKGKIELQVKGKGLQSAKTTILSQ